MQFGAQLQVLKKGGKKLMFKSKYILLTLTVLLIAALVGTFAFAADTLLSQGKVATASTTQGANTPAKANDGNTGTRWAASTATYPQWWKVDLGAINNLSKVDISWYSSSSRSYKYKIEVSNNDSTYTTAVDKTSNTTTGNTSDLFTASGRYVKVTITGCSAGAAYASAYEIQVYGSPIGGNTPTPTIAPTATPIPTNTPTPMSTVTPTPVGPTVTPAATPTSGPTPTGDAFWDRSGIPAAANIMIYKFVNKTNGKYADSEIYWSATIDGVKVTKSIAEQPYIDMTATKSSRVTFYIGNLNGTQYTDFIEQNLSATLLSVNTSRVDWYSLPLAFLIHCKDGKEYEIGDYRWCFNAGRDTVFNTYINEVPAEFKPLAQRFAPYKIVCPGYDIETNLASVLTHYYDSYIDQYWAMAGRTDLKPNTRNVFRCQNPDANNKSMGSDPKLAAAFNRGTALLPQTEWNKLSNFYLTVPANYFSKFWHDHGIAKKSLWFPL